MLLDLLNENGYEKAQSNKKYITLEKKKNEYETALKDAESSVDAAKKQARSAVERRILENAERRKNEALQRKLAEKEKAVGGGGAGGTFLVLSSSFSASIPCRRTSCPPIRTVYSPIGYFTNFL